jgi:hypothetical protein
MPNWSFCQFKIYGEKKHLKNLTSILKRLEKRKTSPVPNDFGNLWWGNIVHLLGGDWKEIPGCRGDICGWDYDSKGGVLTIMSEFAWSERKELRDFIENHYNNEISISYYQEEPGCGIYESNDLEGFGFKYLVDGERNPFPEYYNSLDEVAEALTKYTGFETSATIKSIEKTIDLYEEESDDWLGFHEFVYAE